MIPVFAITAVCMCIFAILYGYFGRKWGNKALIWKALATSMAVVVAGAYVALSGGLYGWLVFIATILCMTADVVLEIHFIKGVLIFGGAHICFAAAYMQITRVRLCTAVCFAVIYVCVLILFRNDIKKTGELRIPAFFYVALLSFMVSMAYTVYSTEKSARAVMLLSGALCFLVSDCIIGFRTLRNKNSAVYGAAILILYYGAVYFISVSAFLRP